MYIANTQWHRRANHSFCMLHHLILSFRAIMCSRKKTGIITTTKWMTAIFLRIVVSWPQCETAHYNMLITVGKKFRVTHPHNLFGSKDQDLLGVSSKHSTVQLLNQLLSKINNIHHGYWCSWFWSAMRITAPWRGYKKVDYFKTSWNAKNNEVIREVTRAEKEVSCHNVSELGYV